MAITPRDKTEAEFCLNQVEKSSEFPVKVEPPTAEIIRIPDPDVVSEKVVFSIFRDTSAVPSGKSMTMAADGSLIKKTHGIRNRLQVQRVSMSLRDLAEALKTVTPDTHLTSGWSERDRAVALCDATLSGLPPPERGAFIGLTTDYIAHRDGPGLMVFDTDGAYGPHVAEALVKAAPGLAGAARIECSSTGSFVYDTSGNRLDKSQGQHTMFGVVDALDIPRAITVMHQRLILTGGLVPRISQTGAFLERTYVDTQLKVPAQPVYLKARCGPGLEQRKSVVFVDGDGLVDTRVAIPDLTDEEKRQVRRIVDEAKKSTRPEMDRVAREYWERRVTELVERDGVDRAAAEREVTAAMFVGELGPNQMVMVEDKWVRVADILAAPGRFHNCNCRDPLEPDYGSDTVGIIYADNPDRVTIYSYAHGGRTFVLVADIGNVGSFAEELSEGRARLTMADLEAADLATIEGRRVVEQYRNQVLRDINRVTGLLMIGGEARIVRRRRDTTGKLTTEFNRIDAERTMWKPTLVPVVSNDGERLEWKPAFSFWESWSGRRAYRGVVFNPRRGVVDQRVLPPFSNDTEKQLDLFVGATYEPQPGECGLIKAHIRDILCGGEDEAYHYVLGWMARMVQRPDLLAETVLVFQTGEGVGKNTIINIFKKYFGIHAVEMTKIEQATGFNDDLGTCVFLSMNEMTWGGNKAVVGTLKALITEEEIQVERKGVPRFVIKNHMHIIVSTNEKWAVPVGLSDRRFVILNCSEARRNDPAYFEPLRAEIDNGGGSAFIHYLLGLNISKFNPRVLPRVGGTGKIQQQMYGAAGTPTAWLFDVLCTGEIGQHLNANANNSNWVLRCDEGLSLERSTVYADYHKYAGHRASSMSWFGREILSRLGESCKSLTSKNGKPSRYEFGHIDDMRAAFAASLGVDIDWSEVGND